MIYDQFVNFVDYLLVWLSNREELNKNKILDIRDHIVYNEPGVSFRIAISIMEINKITISKGDYQVFKKNIENLFFGSDKEKIINNLDKLVDYSIEEIQIFKHKTYISDNRVYGIFEDLIKKEEVIRGVCINSYRLYNQYICEVDKIYNVYAILKINNTRYFLVKAQNVLIFLPSQMLDVKDDIIPEQWTEIKVTIHSNKYKLIGYKPFVDDFRIINHFQHKLILIQLLL
jgi:hypothetical protein